MDSPVDSDSSTHSASDYHDDEADGDSLDGQPKANQKVAKRNKSGSQTPRAVISTTNGKRRRRSAGDAGAVSEKKGSKRPRTVKNGESAHGSSKTVEETYQRKTQLEHILLRPDAYIGSIEPTEELRWVWEHGRMVQRTVRYVPGLYKIFDEILSNAADNKVRDPSMNSIDVSIDVAKDHISIRNNGRGIPVEIHAQEKIYVPELIFGHLLTSSNFNDSEKKVTGGRNGFGAKLCNVFSTVFSVETSDCSSGKKFKQMFRKNMRERGDVEIGKAAKADYTKIGFVPDFGRFGMAGLDEDILGVLRKRVVDMAGVLRNVKVTLDGERVVVKGFKEYAGLYFDSVGSGEASGVEEESCVEDEGEEMGRKKGRKKGKGGKQSVIYESPNERWEVCFALSDGQFQQFSFVNSICTTKGGTQVTHVVDQITSKVSEHLSKKISKVTGTSDSKSPAKGGAASTKVLKPWQIKNHIWVFVSCLIENPTFDSQTKDTLTLRADKFGSSCDLSEGFLKKVLKSGIVEKLVSAVEAKQAKELKKTDGKKTSRISGIPKLDDANNAGTRKASECTLILTEGDSAKSLAISGLSVIGRDNYGVFPLKGKLLNVRDASSKAVLSNEEIAQIKRILGLQQGKSYDAGDKSLRYGRVMIMADQDHDGSHIKGLIINLFDHFWPSLLDSGGFLYQFITPIVKATKGSLKETFYTIPEYEQWKEKNKGRGWKVKYFKGLGTSTAADAKKYFKNLGGHRRLFRAATTEDHASIELAFSKKKREDRKEWLEGFQPGVFLNNRMREIPIRDFVNKELILFSIADCHRSIPSVVDGLKPGQRKIMFCCFKRNLTKNEIKVVQLAGYVSEHSAYHHGEASLNSTIVAMAQDFVGSNNIALLEQGGQFGTRLQGGKDAASPRYIFTKLQRLARLIYHPADDGLLKYQHDDNMSIEPEYYVPVLPMVLVNGASGIGTGWSTEIPNYDPMDVIENLRRRLRDPEAEFVEMKPYYRGFKGSIETTGQKYKSIGLIRRIGREALEVTELPIGTWTQSYKEFLETLLSTSDSGSTPFITDYKEYHTEREVRFVVTLPEENLLLAEAEGLEKRFKLIGLHSSANMVAFNGSGKLHRYGTALDILQEFFTIRVGYYSKRKDWLVDELLKEVEKLRNQARFVEHVIRKQIDLHKKKADLVAQLRDLKFKPMGRERKRVQIATSDDEVSDEEGDGGDDGGSRGYDYLLSMKLWSLTKEKVDALKQSLSKKEDELAALLAKTPTDLWLKDLDEIEVEWNKLDPKTLGKREGTVVNALGPSSVEIKPTSRAKRKAGEPLSGSSLKRQVGTPYDRRPFPEEVDFPGAETAGDRSTDLDAELDELVNSFISPNSNLEETKSRSCFSIVDDSPSIISDSRSPSLGPVSPAEPKAPSPALQFLTVSNTKSKDQSPALADPANVSSQPFIPTESHVTVFTPTTTKSSKRPGTIQPRRIADLFPSLSPSLRVRSTIASGRRRAKQENTSIHSSAESTKKEDVITIDSE
ncbi:DNA topoisomerase [Cladochytrium replicatum]|nr:DNA topoisomerase [Cladochytrium replicatum]